LQYQIVKSRRKQISVEYRSENSLLVRAPLGLSDRRILEILKQLEPQIQKHLEIWKALPSRPLIERKERDQFVQRAKETLLPRLAMLSMRTGLSYHSAKITTAEKRYGSCSFDKRICLSCYLVLLDEKMCDYVILHELCHTVHHNHSKQFYSLLETFLPNWKQIRKEMRGIPIPRLKEENDDVVERGTS